MSLRIHKNMTFTSYLHAIGAEILQTTNEWEFKRFKANDLTCIIYINKYGVKSFSNDMALKVYQRWEKGIPINIFQYSRKGKPTKDQYKEQIFTRDSDKCFYTGKKITIEGATIEHLIPISKGGKDNLDNMVCCIAEENHKMADKNIIDKLKYREKNLYLKKLNS